MVKKIAEIYGLEMSNLQILGFNFTIVVNVSIYVRFSLI